MLLERDPKVVAVIEVQCFCHRIFDQLQAVSDVDPFVLGLCSAWVAFVFDSLEEDAEPQFVGDVLLQVQEGHAGFLLKRLHRTHLERARLLGEHPAAGLSFDVDVVRRRRQEWYPNVDHFPLR